MSAGDSTGVLRASAHDIAYEAYFNTCNTGDVGSDIYARGPPNPESGRAYKRYLV